VRGGEEVATTRKADKTRYARTLWDHAAAKPDAVEDHPWGDDVFKIRSKIFAFLGGAENPSVTVKVPPDEVDAVLELPYAKRSAYIGRYGWVSLSIEDDDALRLALDLIDDSYDLVEAKAPGKRRAAAARSAGSASAKAKSARAAPERRS
jgi:predicted DNA-binding protein (MmcQ/YjbR family)